MSGSRRIVVGADAAVMGARDRLEDARWPDLDARLRYGEDGDDLAHDRLLRASWGACAAEAYGNRTGVHREPVETVLGDLVCDLMHLASACGVQWESVQATARMHYEAEVTGSH